jgi:hypothetical protein
MVRAKYVVHEQGERLLAVYGDDVKRNELKHVVDRLRALPGVQANATRVAFGRPDAPPTTVIWMGVLPMFNRHRAMQLLKELTDPEQPIAIARINLYFRWCSCGHLSHSGDMSFIPSFEPEDEEAFKLRFFAAIQRLDIDTLWKAEPRAPYTPLMDAVAEALAELGAHATDFYFKPESKPQPCTHNG